MTRLRAGKLLAIGLAAVGFSAASAAPLTGAISSVGSLCLGSTPTTPTTAQCTHQDVSTVLFLDFINGGMPPMGLTASPGQPGPLMILTASGDLTPLIGQTGEIHDISLPGPLDPLASFAGMNPLWTAVGSDGATYSYSLTSLLSIFRLNHHALDIRGTGSMCRDGTDCNVFSFLFTTQDADGAPHTTFSLSQSGFATPRDVGKVPEPAALTLLGLGLAGLAIGARRWRA